jgi:hypothetical protein
MALFLNIRESESSVLCPQEPGLIIYVHLYKLFIYSPTSIPDIATDISYLIGMCRITIGQETSYFDCNVTCYWPVLTGKILQ